jgi:hypothetical protein
MLTASRRCSAGVRRSGSAACSDRADTGVLGPLGGTAGPPGDAECVGRADPCDPYARQSGARPFAAGQLHRRTGEQTRLPAGATPPGRTCRDHAGALKRFLHLSDRRPFLQLLVADIAPRPWSFGRRGRGDLHLPTVWRHRWRADRRHYCRSAAAVPDCRCCSPCRRRGHAGAGERRHWCGLHGLSVLAVGIFLIGGLKRAERQFRQRLSRSRKVEPTALAAASTLPGWGREARQRWRSGLSRAISDVA